MSRPLRIECPGAWYHVMNRGRRREDVFHIKADYDAFLKIVKETVDVWNLKVSAYSLLPNHYHLCRKSLAEIGTHFGLSNYSTVSSAVERIKARKNNDPELRQDLDNVDLLVNKSQQQI